MTKSYTVPEPAAAPSRAPHRPRRPRPVAPGHRVRMEPGERVNMILDSAVAFFAEHGFDAQTHDLARTLSVSQSLIYHYFSTKDELVERVYQRTFLSRWRGSWTALLADRGIPLAPRLKRFYASYFRVIDDSNWVRIFMFSGLGGSNFAKRYIDNQINGVLRLIAAEINAEFDPAAPESQPSDTDIELVWHLHSTFIHHLVRKYIFRTATLIDMERLIDVTVDDYLAGAAARFGHTQGVAPTAVSGAR